MTLKSGGIVFCSSPMRVLDGLDDFEGVRARLLADLEHHGRRAVQPREGSRLLKSVHDMADVADANRPAA